MRDGPDLAHVAALIGDPARANMLNVLMGGATMTASELALEACVGLPTASAHLAKLVAGGLVTVSRQGRHRYYALAGPQVAGMLEAIMGVAETVGPRRVRPGPRDAAMREARVCYDHLAGDMGVALFDGLKRKGFICEGLHGLEAHDDGLRWFETVGIDVPPLKQARRPLCKACLDWSARRSHLAGALGAAMLDLIVEKRWASRHTGSRVISFSPHGRLAFARIVSSLA